MLQCKNQSFSLCSDCSYCGCPLRVPWIRCSECDPEINICPHCFSLGVTFRNHESDHPYSIVKLDFPLFESSWTAAEELRLLDALQDHGFGNWSQVSSAVRTKTEQECERHYMYCYVERPSSPLPVFQDDATTSKGAPILFKLSDNPPRPAMGSPLFHDMGGYFAARGDFDVEFNNFVEMDICHLGLEPTVCEDEIQAEEQALYQDMKRTVAEIYNSCLMERHRRKKIVREYGLINMRKWFVFYRHRFDKKLSLDFFRPFMRFFPPITFDKYMESLLYEKQIKSEIRLLQEYRKNGLTRLRSVRMFQRLKNQRQITQQQRHLLEDVLSHIQGKNSYHAWLTTQAALESKSATGSFLGKKKAPPLDIQCLPGYEQLSDVEREFCSEARLVPQSYLDFSRILRNECGKHGYLKLSQARPLIKIDVNKTRKLYDFLIKQGQIYKEPMS